MGFGLHCQVLFQNRFKPEVPCGYCKSSLKKRQLVSKPVGVVVVLSIRIMEAKLILVLLRKPTLLWRMKRPSWSSYGDLQCVVFLHPPQ